MLSDETLKLLATDPSLDHSLSGIPDWHEALKKLNPQDQAALTKLLTPRLNKFIPIKPFPKQTVFLLLPHEEAFYGGAAAGGKSATLLMGAAQYVDVEGYSAILFRRTLSDLQQSGALLDVAHKWWDGRADVKWDGDAHMFRFKNGGTISFGYSDDKRDISRYLGTEFQYIGFDEVTTWEDARPYDALHTRLRKTIDLDVPLRIRAASNPGEVGHEWVMKLFVDPGTKPTKACELSCGLCRFCAGIPYIPATVEDNPYLDPRYKRTLDTETDIVRRAQMRYGDWRIMPKGNVLIPEWFKIGKP